MLSTGIIIVFIIGLTSGIYYFTVYIKIKETKKPNIIIILSDALRKDHLGCYGYKRDTTPNIDLFAKDATLFKNAFAQSPSTKPSIASLFTSRYPSQHNTIYNEDALNSTYITLAEVLKENNYLTAGFIENPVISGVFNYNQGFDSWELDDRRHIEETDESMADFDRKIFTWLDVHYKQPFFLYIHYIDPHMPYNAPAQFKNFFDENHDESKIGDIDKRFEDEKLSHESEKNLEYLILSYDNEVRYIDSRFRELIIKLKQLKILDDSIVIFLSDHGEGFLEHKRFQHSYSVYSELVNMPLIIRYPKLFKKRYEKKYVQQIDIFPTIMYILKIPSDSLSLEGNNILSRFNKNIKIVSEHLIEGWRTPQRCVMYNNWKLIQDIDLGTYSLFNIAEDPLDHKNLIEENTTTANSLKFYLAEWQKNLGDKKEASKVRLDKSLEEKFKSLNYI